MSIVKMFATLLVAAGAMQTLATEARATEVPAKPALSLSAQTAGCGWKHPYNYRYHYRPYRPSPFRHPRAPRPRRKFPTD